MRTALLSLYHALQPVPHLERGGARRTLSRPVLLWVSDPLDHRASPAIRDFIWRAEASAAIEHPAIAPVLDLDEAEGRVYFVTPATDARSLDEQLRRTGPMSPDTAVDLLAGVADGLDVAHAKGLTHGAISPAMIWIDRAADDGTGAHLVGFGLETLLRARARGDQRDVLLEDVVYIAPEQLRGDESGSDQADQYALACALYHCVAGSPPFVRDRTSALFGAHMLARPAPPSTGDREFDDAVLAALSKDPAQRFDSCVTFLEAAAGRTLPRAIVPDEGERQHVSGRGPVGEGERQRAGGQGPAGETERGPEGATERGPEGATERGPQVEHDALEWSDDRMPDVPARAADTDDTPPAGATVIPLPPRGDGTAPTGGSTRQRSTGTWLAWGAAGLLVLVVVAGVAALATGLITRGTDDPQETTQRPAPEPEVEEPQAAATIAWQREIGEEPVTHLSVEDLNAVAATGNNLTVVNPRTGSRRWRKVADVGILTDLTTVGDVLVYRTDVLSGVSLPYGIQLWESDDVRPAAGGMSARGSSVYAISIGRSLPEVSAVDPTTGEERWHFHGHQDLVDNDAAVASGKEVVAVLQRGALFGVNPRRDPEVTDGGDHAEIESEEWRTDVPNPWIETLTASDTEAVFALQNGSVCAYTLSDGDKLWCVPVNGVRDGAPGLLVRNEVVVVVSRDRVVALDLSSGTERWTADATEPLLPLVAVDDGLVYAADADGVLHTFALADGAPQWDVPGPGDVTALVGADGGVIVGTEDGTLARIEPSGDG